MTALDYVVLLLTVAAPTTTMAPAPALTYDAGYRAGYDSCWLWLDRGVDDGAGVEADDPYAFVVGFEDGQTAAGCTLGD